MTTTIGQLTNVPNPGSPITSPWAQDVTRLARHTFTNAAALLAQWPSAQNGAHALVLDTGWNAERIAGQWRYVDPVVGRFTDTIAAGQPGKAFALVFGVTFLAAPIVLGTIEVGGNADLVVNWSGAPTTTGVAGRAINKNDSPVPGGFAIHWVAFGQRAVV